MGLGNWFGGSSSKEEREVDPVTGKPVEKPAAESQNPQATTATSESVQAPVSPRAVNSTISFVEKPLAALSSLTSPVGKTDVASGQSSSSTDALEKADAEHKDDAADRAPTVDDTLKEISIDEEYLRKLYAAVEDNSKQAVEMIGSFNALVVMIQNLSADTVDTLGQKSAQLDAANTELERLKAEEADRVKVVDRLSRENSKLKDKCDVYDAVISDKDTEIARVNNDLKTAQEKCAAKDAEIAGLNKARQDLEAAHADEIAKLKSEYEATIADREKKHDEEVDALNKSAADQIEAVRMSVNEFVPAEVCDLFDYRVGDAIDDRSRWQAIYAYLGFINGNLRQDAFVKRFREFDAALYDAMRDTPDQLAECRVRVQRHVNEVIGKKSGGLLVCWPKIGEACNPDQYTTTSDFGQRISEVISAMIYKKGDDGKVLCQSKGKVATT